MALTNDGRFGNEGDGAKLYRMFQDGTLVDSDATHKAYLDALYNQIINAPDLEVFNRNYSHYLQTYHPYMMRFSYGQKQASI